MRTPHGAAFALALCLSGSAVAGSPAPAFAQAAAPRRVPRVEGSCHIDARLDEEFWKNALLLELAYEVRPGENVPAPVRVDVLADEERVLTQLLFSYKLNPQTVLYLGYSDDYFGYDDIDLAQTDRTFFAKIGYAWVL